MLLLASQDPTLLERGSRLGDMAMQALFYIKESRQKGNWSDFTKYIDSVDRYKGPFVKIAQFLSLQIFLLPRHVCDHCTKFYQDVTPYDITVTEDTLTTVLGENWRAPFEEFDLKAIAGASLGQVHKAKLKEGGRIVACKLQYPGIERFARDDAVILSLFMKQLVRSIRIQVNKIKETANDLIDTETNYEQERVAQDHFAELLRHFSNIRVPRTYPQLSNRKFLVMDYVEGKPLHYFYNADLPIRRQITLDLLHAVFYPFFKHNVLYVDVQPGNFLVDEQGHLWVLDFGLTLPVPEPLKEAVRTLFVSRGENSRPFSDLIQTDDQDLKNILVDMRKILYRPFFSDAVTVLDDATLDSYGKDIIALNDKLSKCKGLANMDNKELIHFFRASDSICAILYRLNPEINYHDAMRQLLERCA